MHEHDYNSLDEIEYHNHELYSREQDMLIELITGETQLTDKVRLDTINEAIYQHGGTVASALVAMLYNKLI